MHNFNYLLISYFHGAGYLLRSLQSISWLRFSWNTKVYLQRLRRVYHLDTNLGQHN
jgi:hypothetical protein